jgi:hypothetical protein
MSPLTSAGDLAGLMLLATATVTTALLTWARARRPAGRAQSEYRHTPASPGDQAVCSDAMISASGK